MTEVICRNCKNKVDKNTAVLHPTKSRFYFCNEQCLAQYESKALQSNTVSQSSKNRRLLTDYIQQCYYQLGLSNSDINWGIINKHINNLLAQQGFTITGIKYTLYYYVEILSSGLPRDFNIKWIADQYYETAKNYYYQTNRCNKIGAEFEPDRKKVVTISNLPKQIKKQSGLIDLSIL